MFCLHKRYLCNLCKKCRLIFITKHELFNLGLEGNDLIETQRKGTVS